MGSADASYGVMLMGDTDVKFRRLRDLMSEFQAGLQTERAAVSESMLGRIDATRFGFLALLAVGLATSLSFIFLVARMTVRPALRLTEAMRKLAGGDTAAAIDRISDTIGEISNIATGIAAAVEQQGAAAQEIARNVQQAAASTSEVSENIGGVTRAASTTGDAAQLVFKAANELARQSGSLRGEVDRFLADIKAA